MAPATPEPPARITQRYWLVTSQSAPGMTGFDIDVYINSKWVRTLRNGEPQVVADITSQLQPGKNAVMLIAHKLPAVGRGSESPEHVFRVIIGEGNMGGRNVMIDNPLVRFQRTAEDSTDFTQEFTLTTR